MATKNTDSKARNSRTKVMLVVLLVIAFAIYILSDIIANGKIDVITGSGPVESEIAAKYAADSKSVFYTYSGKDGYFHATKDGIKYISSSGVETMSESYNIANPVLVGEGSVAAILEKGGNTINVYNPQGKMYSIVTIYPILNFSVNTMGYVSAILKKDEDYITYVFNNKGALQQEGVLVNRNHTPIATDVSNDGRILAISFLDTGGAEVNSFVNFYYLNKSESIEYIDGLFSISGDNPDEIIGMIKFMNNNVLIAVSDKSIKCYEPGSKAVKKAELPLNNKITAISFDEPFYFAVAYGEGQINKESEREGLVRFYDLSLSEKGAFQADGKVNYISCGYGGAIIGTGRTFTAVTNGGGLLWQRAMAHDVKQLLFLGGTSKVLDVGAAEAAILTIGK